MDQSAGQDNVNEVDELSHKNPLYPVFLKMDRLPTLLLGGGRTALDKLHSLLANSPDAKVTIIAPEIDDDIRKLILRHPGCTIVQRAFETTDLDTNYIAILTGDDQQNNDRIAALATEKGLLLNVADRPELSDFYLGSIVQRGNLKIGISTNGKSPAAARRIREVLHEALPGELDEVIDNLQQVKNRLNGNFESRVKRLNTITRVLVEDESKRNERKWKRIASISVIAFALMLIGHFIFSYIPLGLVAGKTVAFYKTLDKNFPWMVLAGFVAQMVDGATSMGYGVTSSILLMSANIPLAAISGSIHTAEMFASGASGYSHYKFGNVNKKLFKALLIPGVIAAVVGAILSVKLGDSNVKYVRPIMAAYTLFLGIRIFITAFQKITVRKKFKRYGWLAAAGGFLDSFSGGGWGPIVTATLITKGRTPRYVVGSVSLTEFFVTLASAFTFFTLIGVRHWQVILALIIGGLIAAPIAARLSGKLPRKASFILLGIIVVIWSFNIFIRAL